jgi:hypothetical protein
MSVMIYHLIQIPNEVQVAYDIILNLIYFEIKYHYHPFESCIQDSIYIIYLGFLDIKI